MCILWLLLGLATFLSSSPNAIADTLMDEENPFAVSVEEGMGVEFYDNGATRFAIFIQKATWEEAKRLCNSRRGGLLEYLDEGVPTFMGQALAESAVGFSSLWIGGQFTPSSKAGEDGVWKWIQTEEEIPATLPSDQEFPMTSAPFWVDRPNLKGPTELCLATDRNMHHRALIVAEPCHKERPYICSIPTGNSSSPGHPAKGTPAVKIGQKIFHLFLDLISWEEALKACREQGMRLAVVTKPIEFEILKNRMQRSRPIMENAWVGGANVDKKWIWIDTYEVINTDPANNDPNMLFPWFRKDKIIMEGCLLVDRHVCDRLVYLEARCDRKRNYICETIQEKPNALLTPFTKVPGYGNYYISNYKETWQTANNICKSCFDGGGLLEIDKTQGVVLQQLPMLYTAMALTLQIELRHVWLGGYLYGTKFKWSHDENADPGDNVALAAADFQTIYGDGEKGVITFCEENMMTETYLLDYKCLNLDRENQKHFMIYGTLCHYKQHYICSAPPSAIMEDFCQVVGYLLPVQRPENGSSSTDSDTTDSADSMNKL